MSLEEFNNRYSRSNAIRRLPPSVPLIGKQDVLDRHLPLFQVLHHLFGFDDGNIRVVRAVQDDGWRFNSIYAVERRQAAQHVGFLVGIAVLNLRDGRHPRLSVFEEGFKVDHTEEVGSGSEEIRILCEASMTM